MKKHIYHTKLKWTGNLGEGTTTYRKYSRDHIITAGGKEHILASSDPSFRGDPTRYNPEELFLASLSACHMLWFLHLCATARIVVTHYRDAAEGTMIEETDGSGRFTEVILKPVVTLKGDIDPSTLSEIHHEANQKCFIANSCNFPIRHQATIE